MLTDKHINHFVDKGKKFLDKYIKYTEDSLGLPSIIEIKQDKYPITYHSFCVSISVERHYCSLIISKIIENYMLLPKEDCKQIANYIVQKKYEQYIKFMMSS